MKTMLLAFAATAVITVGAWFALGEVGFSSDERSAGDAVRLDDS
ncbi:MAG: hypothetical protein NXH84_17075 [Rhodobacteraceae bacterium]|jgi:hypothetical protein|nr:hypothetical protein [Paracoccaceae bacterium]